MWRHQDDLVDRLTANNAARPIPGMATRSGACDLDRPSSTDKVCGTGRSSYPRARSRRQDRGVVARKAQALERDGMGRRR